MLVHLELTLTHQISLNQVDVRIVIAMTISVISMVQYYSSWTNYEDAIKYIMTVPKYRIKATEIAKEDGLLKAATDKKANRGKTKEQIKEQEESVLRKVSFCDAQWLLWYNKSVLELMADLFSTVVSRHDGGC